MSRIIKPVVSPRGRVIVLTGATLWLVAAMVLSAVPDGAVATPEIRGNVTTTGNARVIDRIDGTEGMLYFPRLVVDRRGAMFVTDRGNHRVVRINEDIAAEAVFGREGTGPGEMQWPYDVAVDSSGNVFVTDFTLRRINKFAPDGTFLKSVAAPQAATLLIDSNDELIVYPAPGKALLQRYSNDLVPGEELLEESDDMMHRSRMGVLMAMDKRDRLFLLDQVDLRVTVYNRDMRPILSWPVDGPELQESIARRVAHAQENNGDGRVRVPAFTSMAIDPTGDHIAFSYIVRRSDDEIFSRTVWYTVDGRRLASEDRTDSMYTNALLPDGRLVEGNAEALFVFTRGPRPDATRGN